MSSLSYQQNGDYQIPNLRLQETSQPLGKYGRMRRKYLQEHRPVLWNQMILSETLYPHLLEIEQTADERLETMLPQMAQAAGVTEQLKASDPMTWAGLMNNLKAQAEEIMMKELIFA